MYIKYSSWLYSIPIATTTLSLMFQWSTAFLQPFAALEDHDARALIILNQPFSVALFDRLWNSSKLHYCADGGANQLYDLFEQPGIEDGPTARGLWVMLFSISSTVAFEYPLVIELIPPSYSFLPHLIKGDLDSIRDDVKDYYRSQVSSKLPPRIFCWTTAGSYDHLRWRSIFDWSNEMHIHSLRSRGTGGTRCSSHRLTS